MIDEAYKQHVTPDLPKDAMEKIKLWEKESRYNKVFHRVLEQLSNAECKNCGDAGFIMVSFTRAGPFESVPNIKKNESLTWFDGNELCGKGWYVVEKTMSYPCHHCDGMQRKEDKPKIPPVDPELVQARMRDAADELAESGFWHE